MKTVVLEEPGRFLVVERQQPERLAADHVLVRVRRIGVCGTDLHAFKGVQPFFSYPRVLGHELGVEVLETAADTDGLAPGDVCAVEPYINCGACIACRRNRPNCCVNLRVLGVSADGGMSEMIVVPKRKLHPARNLSFDQLALVEPLSIGAHAVERAQIEPGEFVLVIGAGPIGLAVTQFAQLAGGRVIVMDVKADRLKFCEQHFAIEHALAHSDQILESLQSATDNELPLVVFDATGNRQSMHDSFRYVAHGGRLIFVGLFQGDVAFHDPHAHRVELTLLCSRNATAHEFKKVIQLLEADRINIDPWITHRITFDEIINQFPGWTDSQTNFIKALVELK